MHGLRKFFSIWNHVGIWQLTGVCMQCDYESIDLSNSLFETLNGGSLTAGRVASGITWYFNE